MIDDTKEPAAGAILSHAGQCEDAGSKDHSLEKQAGVHAFQETLCNPR